MPPEKPQIDTLSIYFRSICSEEKTEELLKKAMKLKPVDAQKIVLLFEQRKRVQLRDLNKFFK